MSPPIFRKQYPLNTSLVPGHLYFVIWEFKSSNVILFRKPKKPGEHTTIDEKQFVRSNDMVLYVETVQNELGYWYKLWKGDELGYVKSDMIDLFPVQSHEQE